MGQASPLANPVNFIDPTLQTQQAQLDRQQALAAQLRSSSFQDSPSNGGRVSWTQGLARLADALVGKSLQKKADTAQSDLAGKYGAALGRMFGGGQPQGAAPIDAAPDAPAQLLALPATDQSIDIPPQPQPPAAAPAPASMPAGAGAPSRGPLSLTGDPQQDMSMYAMAPDKYMEGVIASHSPVEFAKFLQQSGIDPSSPIGRQLMQSNLAKQNYVAPVTGRPGAIQRDPYTNQIIGVDPQNIEGLNPVVQNGQFTGSYTPAPGAAPGVAQMEAAKAGGRATQNPVQVFDPTTGAPMFSTQAQVAGAAHNGQPMQAGPGLGAQAAFNVTGTNSANAFQDISNGAADVPNRIYALNQMGQIAADPKAQFGAGSEGLNQFRGHLATLAQGMGIAAPTPLQATNANEFQKWATQYSARSGQELGLSGSDARTQLAVHATPNGEMTREALQSVIPQMVGIENAKQGYANAANSWQQQHGPQTVQQFRAEWNKVYDPAIYTHMSQGPQAFAGWVKSLSPAEAAAARQKYITLKSIGALPQ